MNNINGTAYTNLEQVKVYAEVDNNPKNEVIDANEVNKDNIFSAMAQEIEEGVNTDVDSNTVNSLLGGTLTELAMKAFRHIRYRAVTVKDSENAEDVQKELNKQ